MPPTRQLFRISADKSAHHRVPRLKSMSDTQEFFAVSDPPPPESAAQTTDEAATETTKAPRKLGAFTGVFRPTLLTIIGIMLYLREGWMVGNAGILGSLGVILLVFLINGTTSLSVSTMTTNIRLGGGGAFSLVSQSLGLEAGGAIGIPLFLALAMSVALYIYGFAAGWGYLFPHTPRGSSSSSFLWCVPSPRPLMHVLLSGCTPPYC